MVSEDRGVKPIFLKQKGPSKHPQKPLNELNVWATNVLGRTPNKNYYLRVEIKIQPEGRGPRVGPRGATRMLCNFVAIAKVRFTIDPLEVLARII